MTEPHIAQASRNAERNRPSSAGAKVTVACKLPNGYRMRVFQMVEGSEPVLGGGRRVFQEGRLKGEVFINGNAKRVEESFGCQVVGGYALTHGVDKDFFDAWFAANKDEPIVTNGLIFAHGDASRVADQAKEQRGVFSNLEPMNRDPMADPRTPRDDQFKVEEGKRVA